MITLETGLPGAGKTLYCVDKLLRPLVGAFVDHEDAQGNSIKVPRVIYTNINGLLLEHEKIGPGCEWHYDDKRGTLSPDKAWTQQKDADKFGLNNWHEWAKPGSVIVYDEIQKPWPLAATGSRVPPCITALETHRHMGVDFIVLTQHPMLIHANLVRLVGRHLHIRRMGNMGLTIHYEWDSCSRTLLYKNALSKSPYKYNKEVFSLYKSAEMHTKQPRRIPSLVWGVLLGLGALAWFGPAAYGRIAERVNPTAVTAKAGHVPAAASSPGQKSDSVLPASDATTTTVENPLPPPSPEIVGCGQLRSVCRCYDKDGVHVLKPESFCTGRVTPAVALAGLKREPDPPAASTQFDASDAATLEWMAKRR